MRTSGRTIVGRRSRSQRRGIVFTVFGKIETIDHRRVGQLTDSIINLNSINRLFHIQDFLCFPDLQSVLRAHTRTRSTTVIT